MSSSTSERILLVDDDQALLDALRRSHRKTYDLHTACGGLDGLETLEREGPFAVVVSDYQMPGMNGITFLARVREAVPDTVRVMLTGNADLQSAIDAVNRGSIFRFLTKPCPPDVFTSGLEAAMDQYRLRTAERFLLERTVRGSIEVLADVLALANPSAFGRSKRVRSYVRQVAAELHLEDSWQFETAALLSQIGLVAVPPDIIDKLVAGETLSPEHERVIERHPSIAYDLLGKIPRLERVAQIVAHQHTSHQDAERTGLDGTTATGARILGATLDFDELVSLGATRGDALDAMDRRQGSYDPVVLKALRHVELPGQRAVTRSLAVKDLRIGMVLDEDVLTTGGAKLVASGHEISQSILARLRNYAELRGVAEPIRVRVGMSKGGSMPHAA